MLDCGVGHLQYWQYMMQGAKSSGARRAGVGLFSAIGNGNADRFKGFAAQCMAEYDLEGWTAPDLIDPGDVSIHG